jgi:hypothetical protein
MLKQSIPMKLSEIKKKFRRSLFLSKLWFWAAVHSPAFQDCEFRIYKLPITVAVDNPSCGSVFLSISLEFNHLAWFLYIPSDVYSAFNKLSKQHEATEHVDENDIDNIPF